MGRIIENYWDCPYCGTKDILGRYRECPNCSKPRGTDTEFKMKDKHNYVSEEVAKTISKEPDWYCEYCNSLNNAKDEFCKSCGSSKTESTKNYFDIKKENKISHKKEGVVNSESNIETIELTESKNLEKECSENLERNYFQNIQKSTDSQNNKKIYSLKNVLIWSLIVLLTLGVGAGIIYACIPKEDNLKVVETYWERTINIEEEKTVQESDWSIPSGGRLLYSRDEIHHYEKVIDHYETVTEQKSKEVIDHYEEVVTGHRDLGNGYSEEITSNKPVYKTEYYTETHEEPVYRDEPIYKTKYYYEIERYFYKRNVHTSGNDSPYWGEVILEEKERRGSDSEKYTIQVYNKENELKTYPLSYSVWKEIKKGDELHVKIHIFNRIEILDKNGDVVTELNE